MSDNNTRLRTLRFGVTGSRVHAGVTENCTGVGLTLGLATIATAAPPPAASRGSSPEAGHRATAGQGSDKDNCIDIVLAGQRPRCGGSPASRSPPRDATARSTTPAAPGNDPTPGVPYTSPGPRQLQPVWVALKNLMTVTFIRRPFAHSLLADA